jgi:hypothetical protein
VGEEPSYRTFEGLRKELEPAGAPAGGIEMARRTRGLGPPHPAGILRLLSMVVAFLFVSGLVPSPAVGLAGEAELLRARRAAQSLTEQLRERLESRLKDAGAGAALKVCTYQAQGVARDLEQTQGVTVKRASLKARNPLNSPDEWEKAVLKKYSDATEKGWGMEEVFERVEAPKGGKGTWRYAKPILVQKGCLVCHGSSAEIPAEVAEGLLDKYPGDPATGYRSGDLRGIVSVRFSE